MVGNTPPIEGFNCPACDWPIKVRSMGRASVVACESCGTIIDTENRRLRIIQRFQEEKLKPLIELGTRGTFKKTEYELIGFMVRSDESGMYAWEEYLLINPYKGFAWLVQADGHWNFLQPIKDGPRDPNVSSAWYARKRFRHFMSDKPRVVSVLGEFYWQVSTGDRSSTNDFISPPYLLSSDETEGEINWTYGFYMFPAEVEKAFGLSTKLARPVGVAMNQPNPWRGRANFSAIGAVIAAIGLVFAHNTFAPAKEQMRYNEQFIYDPSLANGSKVTTSVFSVVDRMTNVAVDLQADVENSWLDVNLTLVNTVTGASEEVDAEVAYYHGMDSDGAWSEGGTKERFYFVGVEPGSYMLSGEVTAGSTTSPTRYSITVTQGVGMTGNLILAIIAVLLVPVVCILGAAIFESTRSNLLNDG